MGSAPHARGIDRGVLSWPAGLWADNVRAATFNRGKATTHGRYPPSAANTTITLYTVCRDSRTCIEPQSSQRA